MSKEYIKPEQVSPDEARRVIDFLNNARTPEEIDAAVEIVAERDVGVRIGRRILKRRDELGGFTSLEQIDAIPQVGPERFSEIVTTLGRPSAAPPQVSSQTIVGLQDQIKSLETIILRLKNTFGSLLKVSMRSMQDAPYLGQPVGLVVEVVDLLENEPRGGVRVLVTSSWGKLRAFDGAGYVQGSVVSALTNVQGQVMLTLWPPTSEDLWDIQQHALEVMLDRLDPQAASPEQLEGALQDLARHYYWEANEDFRRAVDIYFRDLQPQLLDTINFRDYMLNWTYFDANVMAFTAGEASMPTQGSSTGGGAAIHIRFKNWLGPFLQTYRDLPELSGELQQRFLYSQKETSEPSVLIGKIYKEMESFASQQRGRLGSYMARKIVDKNVTEFLSTRIQDLPPDLKTAITPVLQDAANMVATSETTTFAAMAQMRTELIKEMNLRLSKTDLPLG